MLQAWLDAAEEALTTPFISQTNETVSQPMLISQAQQDQKNLLGMVIAFRALLRCFEADGEVALSLCQQALTLLSADNTLGRMQIASAQFVAYYTSSANDVVFHHCNADSGPSI
jgi:hypothetical protein